VCFADIRQPLTLSINGDRQKTSNTNDKRVSKFQLQRLRKKISLRFFVTTSVTLINCTLVSVNPVRARASLLWTQPVGPLARPGLRPELIPWVYSQLVAKANLTLTPTISPNSEPSLMSIPRRTIWGRTDSGMSGLPPVLLSYWRPTDKMMGAQARYDGFWVGASGDLPQFAADARLVVSVTSVTAWISLRRLDHPRRLPSMSLQRRPAISRRRTRPTSTTSSTVADLQWRATGNTWSTSSWWCQHSATHDAIVYIDKRRSGF